MVHSYPWHLIHYHSSPPLNTWTRNWEINQLSCRAIVRKQQLPFLHTRPTEDDRQDRQVKHYMRDKPCPLILFCFESCLLLRDHYESKRKAALQLPLQGKCLAKQGCLFASLCILKVIQSYQATSLKPTSLGVYSNTRINVSYRPDSESINVKIFVGLGYFEAKTNLYGAQGSERATSPYVMSSGLLLILGSIVEHLLLTVH